jgi:hypothetical protein
MEEDIGLPEAGDGLPEAEAAADEQLMPEPPADQDMEEAEMPVVAEPEPPAEESRARRALRRGIRWVAGLLLVFAFGALTVTLAFYLPNARNLSRAEAERNRAEEQIEALQDEIAGLEAELAAMDQASQQEADRLDEADLHVHILSALADVYSAEIALEQEDPDGARLALTNTPDTLEALANLVGAPERDGVLAMQQRIELALALLEDDPEAALSDLAVLATNLVKLENTYFISP